MLAAKKPVWPKLIAAIAVTNPVAVYGTLFLQSHRLIPINPSTKATEKAKPTESVPAASATSKGSEAPPTKEKSPASLEPPPGQQPRVPPLTPPAPGDQKPKDPDPKNPALEVPSPGKMVGPIGVQTVSDVQNIRLDRWISTQASPPATVKQHDADNSQAEIQFRLAVQSLVVNGYVPFSTTLTTLPDADGFYRAISEVWFRRAS